MRTEEVMALFELPFNDLVFRAQSVHREHFDPNAVQLSTLLSVKTGGCPEDCAYCPQSRALRHRRGRRGRCCRSTAVIAAREAREDERRDPLLHGRGLARPEGPGPATRSLTMVRGVKALGLETCATLGMLKRRPGRAAARCRARLLQPQPRHLARVLRQDHHARAPTTTGSRRSSACAARASTSAAAASSAWANRVAIARR